MTKLSQLHSKSKGRSQMSEMEKELEGGISDDTATAAAEQALLEAANTMTEQHQDVMPENAQEPPEQPAADDAAAQTADESTDRQVEEAAAALAAAQEAIAAQARSIDGQPVPKEVQQEIDNAQEALAAEAAKLLGKATAGQK